MPTFKKSVCEGSSNGILYVINKISLRFLCERRYNTVRAIIKTISCSFLRTLDRGNRFRSIGNASSLNERPFVCFAESLFELEPFVYPVFVGGF